MNIFEIFLQSLGVPYTPTYTAQRYMTHPHRDNLLGLWQLSRDYGIHTQGVTIANRSIEEVSLPSILHLSDHFVVLTDWDEQYVACIVEYTRPYGDSCLFFLASEAGSQS